MSQPEAQPGAALAKRERGRLDLSGLGPLAGLVLLFIVGAVLNRDFASWGNITNVLTRASLIGIIAVGATFVIISGGLDLSVGGLLALQSGVAIIVMNSVVTSFGADILTIMAGMAVAVGLGVLAGLAHGLLITRGRIDAFIVTLGTAAIYRALVTQFAQGGTLVIADSKLVSLYNPIYFGQIFGFIPVPVLVFLVVGLVGGLLLNRTRYGRYVQAIGSNEAVARYSAINVDAVKVFTYILQGVCVSIATILYIGRLGSASNATAIGWELQAIAAVIIGGTSLKGGFGRISGTVMGAVLLDLIGNVLNITSLISEYLNPAVQGLVIIIVSFFQRAKRAR